MQPLKLVVLNVLYHHKRDNDDSIGMTAEEITRAVHKSASEVRQRLSFLKKTDYLEVTERSENEDAKPKKYYRLAISDLDSVDDKYPTWKKVFE